MMDLWKWIATTLFWITGFLAGVWAADNVGIKIKEKK
jgi:hypothetical protein